jgi:hypothetical protein
MQKQRDYLQSVKNEVDILPIEQEFLSSTKKVIENKLGHEICFRKKYEVHPIYDCYLISGNDRPFLLKVNLSPDLPNSWDLLSKNNYNFHPKVICSSSDSDEFNFICFEVPKGMFLSDISNYPLSPKLKLQNTFLRDLKQMHSVKIKDEDETVKVFDCFLPRELMMIAKKYPVVQLFSAIKMLFKKIYKPEVQDCGLCHFDLAPENIIYTGTDIKFINFEYSANANIYLDILLAKETLNCSNQTFEELCALLPKDYRDKLLLNKEASNLFNFAYLNSKITSEYITFGLRNPPKLKSWINKSEYYYNKIFDELFVEKQLDKVIRDFYYLWKS